MTCSHFPFSKESVRQSASSNCSKQFAKNLSISPKLNTRMCYQSKSTNIICLIYSAFKSGMSIGGIVCQISEKTLQQCMGRAKRGPQNKA